MKNKILIEKDLFWEDTEKDAFSVISKYFEVHPLEDDTSYRSREYMTSLAESYPLYRTSLNVARRMGKKFAYADASKFLPFFREESVNPSFEICDLHHIKTKTFPRFVRPCAPYKEFSGNVYTKEKFENEYNFAVTNKNLDPFTLCIHSTPVWLFNEYRCIFINREYVSGSQYMQGMQPMVASHVPEEVVAYAKGLAEMFYFDNVFDFVLDVADIGSTLKLVEINAFETASFYAADLDKIYHTWNQLYQ